MPPPRSGRLPPRTPLDLAVVGHVVVDRFLDAPHLPVPERTTPLRAQRVALGGTAGTIARVAARSGLRVGLSSWIGADFPREFLDGLRAEGVDLAGIHRDPTAASSTCFIVEDGRGAQMTLIDQGVFADGRPVDLDPAPVRRAGFAHLTTAPTEPLLELAESLRGGPRIGLEPAQEIHYRWDGRQLRRGLAMAEILFGNREEIRRAARLLGVASIPRLTDRVPLVVLTDGARGARAYARTGTVHVPAVRPARIRQVTGAGDAFKGGFYGAWIRGRPMERCLRAGNDAAARWMAGPPPLRPAGSGAGVGRR